MKELFEIKITDIHTGNGIILNNINFGLISSGEKEIKNKMWEQASPGHAPA